MHVPCLLRGIRGDRSVREVAEAAAINRGIISQLERGVALPLDKWVAPLERAYGKPLHEWYPPQVLVVLTAGDGAG